MMERGYNMKEYQVLGVAGKAYSSKLCSAEELTSSAPPSARNILKDDNDGRIHD